MLVAQTVETTQVRGKLYKFTKSFVNFKEAGTQFLLANIYHLRVWQDIISSEQAAG
jgi:hypothetical protein